MLAKVFYASSRSTTHFVPDHLVVSLLLGDDTKILMRPSVASDLMSFSNHARDDPRPALALVIDGTFVDVDTGDEESGFSTV